MKTLRQVRGLIEPLRLCTEQDTLAQVQEELDAGRPVAVRCEDTWELLLPETAAGYPSACRLGDLPLRRVPILSPDLSIHQALSRLMEENAAHAFVVDAGQVLGIVVRGRLLDRIVQEAQRAEQLDRLLQESLTFSRTLIWRLPVSGQAEVSTTLPRLEIHGPVEEMLGYPADAFARDPEVWLQDVHPDDQQEVTRRFSELLDHGESTSWIYRLRHRDGHWVWLRDYVRLERDDDGRPLVLRGVTSDVTELMQLQERLRESESLFRMLTEEALVGVYLIVDDRFVYFNPAGARLFGYEPEEIIGRLGPTDLTYPEDRPLVRENIRKRLTGEVEAVRYTFRGLRKDGSVFYVEVLGHRIQYQGRTAILGMLIDVTERVQRQQEEALLTRVYQVLSQRRPGKALEEALAVLGHALPIDGAVLLIREKGEPNFRLIRQWARVGWEENVAAIQEELAGWEMRDDMLTDSMLDVVLQTREPLYVPDLAQSSREIDRMVVRHDVRTVYILPLSMQEDFWAVLALGSGQVDALSEHQQAMVRRLISTFAAAVEAWRYEEEQRRLLVAEQQRRRELEAINAIVSLAATARDLQNLLENTLAYLLSALDLEIGAVWAQDFAAIRGLPPESRQAFMQTARAADMDIPGPVAVEDWRQVSGEKAAVFAPLGLRYGIRSSLTVPILSEGQRIGGVALASPEPRAWSAEEIALVESVGRQLGAAVERLRLFQEVQTHDRLMARLATLSETLNRSFAMEEVVAAIGEGAMTLSEADRVAMYVRNPDDTVSCLWARGLSDEYIAQITTRAREIPGGRLLDEPKPLLASDIRHFRDRMSPWLWELTQAEGYRALALWPLTYEGRLVAVIGCYYDAPRTWSEAEQEVMEAFARQAAIALENARLYASLQEANRELQEALQAKDEMIQNVSHELRTPLSLIKGYVELLEAGALGALNEQQAEAVNVMRRQGERLHYMVNRLLTLQRLSFGRLDAEQLAKEPVDVAEKLRNTVQAWRARAEAAGIRLHLDISSPLPLLTADPDLLDELLNNLLDNAIKFSPRGGEIHIRAWAEDGEICIAVSDQGVGIPPDKLERIFDRFYQVEGGASRRFAGMGIGLALCRAVAEAHGGRIWAESRGQGKGSTFFVRLPALDQGASLVAG